MKVGMYVGDFAVYKIKEIRPDLIIGEVIDSTDPAIDKGREIVIEPETVRPIKYDAKK